MKAVRSLVVLVSAALGVLSASAAWTIDDSDSNHVLISDGNWTFEVGRKGNYPEYSGAIKSVSGFQLKAVVTIPTGAAVETLDFSTFKEDTRAKQAEMGLSDPYGVTSSIVLKSDLQTAAIKTFIGPDFVRLSSMFGEHPTLESITVSPDFCDNSQSILLAPATPVLKTFSPTVLPNWKAIGKKAFYNQYLLKGDFVFANVTEIGESTFYGARAITSLSFPALVDKVGNLPFSYMDALKSFYAPQCTTVGASLGFYGCSSLGDVTLSPDVNALGPSSFYGCTSLTNLTPMTFPLVTSIGQNAFANCSALRGVLSFPEVTTLGDGVFGGSSVDEVYMPKAPMNTKNLFNRCTRLQKATVLGNSDPLLQNVLALQTVGTVVHWLGDDVPPSISSAYSIGGSGSSPVIICLHTKAAQDAWVARWATRTADQLTDADKAMPTYPGPKATLAYCSTVAPDAVANYFWLTKYVETVKVTVLCPEGVEVAGVTQDGFPLKPNADGTYDADASDTMAITYRVTGDRIFADGTVEHTVADVAVAATIPASTCDLAVVPAAARIGETKYVSLQAAFDVGGDVTMIGDQSLSESVTVVAGKSVTFDLNDGVLTAAGITAFVCAGSLEVRNGTVMDGSLVSNTGTFVVKKGVYSEDVTPWCAPGFHVVAQTTEPPTWRVVENVSYTLSLALAAMEANHISGADLSCDGMFTCVTNDGVVVWSVPEALPYALTYTAEPGYLFGTSRTATVVNAEGLSGDATVEPADLPAPEKHAVWTWDEKAQTLTDGNWTFNGVKKNTDYGYTGLQITSATFTQEDAAVSNVDFSTCAATAGWPLIGVTAGFGDRLHVTKFVAPDLVRFNSTFSGNKTIEEVVVSPDVRVAGIGCFSECPALRKFKPTKLPNLQSDKKIFYNCPNLEGDFELDAWTEINQDNPFTYCAKVTSLRLPNLTACNKSSEFAWMTSLTNFYAPKLTYLYVSTLRDNPALKSVVLSDAVSWIGNYAFYGCTSLESVYPTRMTNLTNLGTSAFAYSSVSGDFEFSGIPLLGESVFRECGRLRSVKAPLAEVKGKFAFNLCTNLVNLTVKGGTDLSGNRVLWDVCPNLVVDWLGPDIPAVMNDTTICGFNVQRITICVHDEAARNAWLDAFATRRRANFTDEDLADPTYPGKYTKGVHVKVNRYWITRPPSGLGLSVIVK